MQISTYQATMLYVFKRSWLLTKQQRKMSYLGFAVGSSWPLVMRMWAEWIVKWRRPQLKFTEAWKGKLNPSLLVFRRSWFLVLQRPTAEQPHQTLSSSLRMGRFSLLPWEKVWTTGWVTSWDVFALAYYLANNGFSLDSTIVPPLCMWLVVLHDCSSTGFIFTWLHS